MEKGSMVLEEDSTREEFVEAMEELGLELVEEQESEGETVPYVSNWNSPDGKVQVQYIEEPRLGVNFVLFQASNLAHFARVLGEKLFWYGVDELYERAEYATTHNEGVKAIFRLTAGICTANNLPPRAKHIYLEYLAQEHWMTRRAAVQAVAYGRWPESVEILEHIVTQDPDERVRDFASLQLSNVKKDLVERGISI
ncbi:hypothetical protein NUACC21_54020 [Scytonema sp. NUACC21]